MANGIVLNIDTTKSEFQNPMVQLRQGDGNYQSLSVTVTSNGEPFDLTGWTITFMGTTDGGFKIIDAASVVTNASQGEFTYTPTKAWGQDQGEFKNAYFKFVKADETASGASFRVNVLDAVDLTAEEAGDYISIVDQTINKLTGDLSTLQTSVDQLKAQNNNIKTSDNNWTGTNTFNKKIIAPAGVQGNADTSTKLQTPRKINGTNFDGTADINVNASNDSDIVHKSGNETISGDKTFTGTIYANNRIQGSLATKIANFTDLATVAADMYSYQGFWWFGGSGTLLNSPISQYVLVEVFHGSTKTNGYIRVTASISGDSYYTNINNGLSTWNKYAKDATVVHNTGDETVAGNKTFTGNNNLIGTTTLKTGNYGLRVTTNGIQKTSDGGTTWVNI